MKAIEPPIQVATIRSARRWWTYGAVVMLLATGGFAVFRWAMPRSPQVLLDLAMDASLSDAERGLSMLEQSILAAGGQFAEAQLIRCLMLVKMGRAQEAEQGFAEIKVWPVDQRRSKWLPHDCRSWYKQNTN